MTYPNQQQGGYPNQQQGGYPNQQQGGYPAQQGYEQQAQQRLPESAGGYQQQQGPPPVPVPPSTLADWAAQPSGGSKPLQFPDRAYGTRYTFIVPRLVNDGDTEVQRDKQNQPRRFRDGTFMKVLKVPCVMPPSAEYPDGTADWYVKGNDQAELVRAMGEAGVPRELMAFGPEAQSVITVEYTHDRAVPGGFNPAKIKRVTYQRPQGAAAAEARQGNGQVQQPAAPAQPAIGQPAPPVGQPPAPLAPVQPAPATAAISPGQQVASAAQAGIAAAQQVQAQQPPVQQPPPSISPENAALIAQLQGQQAPQ